MAPAKHPDIVNISDAGRRLGRSLNAVRNRLRIMKHEPERNLLPWPPIVDPVRGSPCWTITVWEAWEARCRKRYGRLP